VHDQDWWHGSTRPLTEIRPFLHLGTIEQARMRGGRGCHLTKVAIESCRKTRKRDKGHWTPAELKRLLMQKTEIIVYLNRYEGIPLEEFDAARLKCAAFDDLPDAGFARLVPSAADSIIIVDPGVARIVSSMMGQDT